MDAILLLRQRENTVSTTHTRCLLLNVDTWINIRDAHA